MEKLPTTRGPAHLNGKSLNGENGEIVAQITERSCIPSLVNKIVLIPGQLYFVPGWKLAAPLVGKITKSIWDFKPGYLDEQWRVEHQFWKPMTTFIGTLGQAADLVFLVEDKLGFWYGKSIPFMVPVNSHEDYTRASILYAGHS